MANPIDPTARSTVKRLPGRGEYDRAVIDRILDEGLVCHVGFAVEGQPFVIPTTYVRIDDKVYIHGSPASRMLQVLEQGARVCVTVTLVDGIVLARSAFHHSINYRSVVVFGTASTILDSEEKTRVLRALVDHIIPGRWPEIRPPDANELKRTLVVAIAIEEASAKIRTGPPVDDDADYSLSVWAGVVPLKLAASSPISDPKLSPEIATPAHAASYSGPQ